MYAKRSRYAGLPTAMLTGPVGCETPYTPALRPVSREPGPRVLRPSSADRPDLVAARACGDPTLFWRVADVNALVDPFDLTRVPGRPLRLPAQE